jgi:hypothetical protein
MYRVKLMTKYENNAIGLVQWFPNYAPQFPASGTQ